MLQATGSELRGPPSSSGTPDAAGDPVPADRPSLRLPDLVARLRPGAELVRVEPLAPDQGATSGASAKRAGYGEPARLVLRLPDGRTEHLVWRVAGENAFGHDRRSDRAASTLQSYDDFATIPDHVAPIDVGAIGHDGSLSSLRDATELYLVTAFAPGTVYAEDLRRVASTTIATPRDVRRLDSLAAYLADLHRPIANARGRYRRAIRDLVGAGEGVFGIVDGYPEHISDAVASRLRSIERSVAEWRWKLRGCDDRLVRTHGDFHPFNVVFDDADTVTLLDASRGACGDAADDLTALAVNFVLFAVDVPGAWPAGLGVLWRRWWSRYLERRSDPELLRVASPFFAWRTLVVCNPAFYPNLTDRGRDRLLALAERYLDLGRLVPELADEAVR